LGRKLVFPESHKFEIAVKKAAGYSRACPRARDQRPNCSDAIFRTTETAFQSRNTVTWPIEPRPCVDEERDRLGWQSQSVLAAPSYPALAGLYIRPADVGRGYCTERVRKALNGPKGHHIGTRLGRGRHLQSARRAAEASVLKAGSCRQVPRRGPPVTGEVDGSTGTAARPGARPKSTCRHCRLLS